MLDIDGEIGVNDASSGLSSTNDFDAVGIDDDDSVLGGRVDLEVVVRLLEGVHAVPLGPQDGVGRPRDA